MTQIELYTNAVASRKAIRTDKKTINFAIASQLEENDIPRLIEIIRIQAKGIAKVLDFVIEEEFNSDIAEEMGVACSIAHLKAEEIAAEGSKKKWGSEQDGNGHRRTGI